MRDNCVNEDKYQQENDTNNDKLSISNILDIISSVFKFRQPASDLPPLLIMTGSKIRPGLSAKEMAARVISRFSQVDAVSGEVFQGGNNVMTALEVIRMEEIVNAIQTEAKVSTVIDPSTIEVKASGANGGGPVEVTGTNTNIVSTNGIIQ